MKLKTVLLLAALATVTGCSYDLRRDLSEDDANDIYTLLAKNGITAKKLVDTSGNEPTFTIVVGKTDAAQATELLRTYSLPRPRQSGFEVFEKNKGMIPTEVEQKGMLLKAWMGEVERTINKVDGVLDTKAIVSLPDSNDLTQPEKKAPNTAAVLVKFRPSMDGRPPVDEAQLKRFVANSLPEMKPENVSILLTVAQPPSADVTERSRLVSVLWFQVTAASADQLKLLIGAMGALMMAMLGLTAYMFLRAPVPAVAASGIRRPTRPPAEG